MWTIYKDFESTPNPVRRHLRFEDTFLIQSTPITLKLALEDTRFLANGKENVPIMYDEDRFEDITEEEEHL